MGRHRRSDVELAELMAAGTEALAPTGRRRRRRSHHRVFVLEYHDVSEGPESEGTVAAWRLRRHIRWLKRRFQFETLSAAAELLGGSEDLTSDRVVLTFDDGLSGNYRWAWPVLRDEGIPATIFLTTGFLDGADLWFDTARRGLEAAVRAGGRLPMEARRALETGLERWPPRAGIAREVERLKHLRPELRARVLAALEETGLPLGPAAKPLTWDQVREMQSGGIEMGCHTITHPVLSTLPPPRQEAEIVGSRDRIAEETGRIPTTFAMPNGARGDYDDATLEILRANGFTAACTTVRGANTPGCDLLTLRRIGVGSDSNLVVRARLSGLFDQEVRDFFAGARRLMPW